MSQGTWVLFAALALGFGFGVYRTMLDGRFRGTRPVAGASAGGADGGVDGGAADGAGHGSRVSGYDARTLTVDDIGGPLGDRATLLQFSSAFCAPCRATRRVLADVAGVVPGVSHVEVDAEQHLDLVRRVGITRTPTTLILDAGGREVARAAGAPRKEAVLASLAAVLDPPPGA